jgi:hypothetical protein
MLDRSEPNLFDPTCSPLHSCEEREHDSPAPEPLTGGADISTGRRRARGRVRHVARYAPTVVILLMVMTHPIGCAGHASPAATRMVTQTMPPKPKAISVQPRTPAPAHRSLPVVRRRRATARSASTPPPAPVSWMSAPVAVPVPPATRAPVPSSPSGRVTPAEMPGVEFKFER